MKTKQKFLTDMRQRSNVIFLFLLCFFLLNCNNDENSTITIKEECDKVLTIDGTLLLNGEEVPISYADLVEEEYIDGTNSISFTIGAPDTRCKKLYSIMFQVDIPVGVNAIKDGTYYFNNNEAEEIDITGIIFKKDLFTEIKIPSTVSSGSIDIIINDQNNYTLDINAKADDGEELNILITHEF